MDLLPTAWRARHDDFAVDVRQLRRLGLEGPSDSFAEQLSALSDALPQHMAYEEEQLLPRYAATAPPEGPGRVDSVRRDHRLIRDHLAALSLAPQTAAEALFVADRAAKLEHLLEHHDLREARFVLPALDALGVCIDLDELPVATVPLGPLGPVRWPPEAPSPLEAAAQALAQGQAPSLPDPPSGGRQERHAAKAARQLAAAADSADPTERRDHLLAAFDAVARWRWMTAGARRVPEP
mgnify:CR=1 FL=1